MKSQEKYFRQSRNAGQLLIELHFKFLNSSNWKIMWENKLHILLNDKNEITVYYKKKPHYSI